MSDTIQMETQIYNKFLEMAVSLSKNGVTVNGRFDDLGKAVEVILKKQHLRLSQKALNFNIAKATVKDQNIKQALMPPMG